MKKTIIISAVTIISIAANAQGSTDPIIDRALVFDIVNICAVVLMTYLITSFILQMTKQNFDYRLKNKVIEKETPENITSQLLQHNGKKDNRKWVLQWIFVMAGIGTGATIMNFSRPFGLHSVAIMAFSIAAGFLGYYFSAGRQKNN